MEVVKNLEGGRGFCVDIWEKNSGSYARSVKEIRVLWKVVIYLVSMLCLFLMIIIVTRFLLRK